MKEQYGKDLGSDNDRGVRTTVKTSKATSSRANSTSSRGGTERWIGVTITLFLGTILLVGAASAGVGAVVIVLVVVGFFLLKDVFGEG